MIDFSTKRRDITVERHVHGETEYTSLHSGEWYDHGEKVTDKVQQVLAYLDEFVNSHQSQGLGTAGIAYCEVEGRFVILKGEEFLLQANDGDSSVSIKNYKDALPALEPALWQLVWKVAEEYLATKDMSVSQNVARLPVQERVKKSWTEHFSHEEDARDWPPHETAECTAHRASGYTMKFTEMAKVDTYRHFPMKSIHLRSAGEVVQYSELVPKDQPIPSEEETQNLATRASAGCFSCCL